MSRLDKCSFLILSLVIFSCNSPEEGGASLYSQDSASTGTSSSTSSLLGQWGGEGIRLEVGAKGVDIEFECATGTISEGLILDERGSVLVSGSYFPGARGPMIEEPPTNAIAVTYSVSVTGDEMSFKVEFPTEVASPLAPARGAEGIILDFTLIRNATPRLFTCQ